MTPSLPRPDDLPSAGARVVLLGASNVRIGLATALQELVRRFASPLQVSVAAGHGRSYGRWSYVPFRGLPGITQCELWQALRETPDDSRDFVPPPAYALVTDVGNDLLYGVEVDQILRWVESCLKELRVLNAATIVTLPPVDRLQQLSWLRFTATRTLFFPASKLTRASMLADVELLRQGLIQLAEQNESSTFQPPLDWYGFDPIHIRRSRRAAAWRTLFRLWNGPGCSDHRPPFRWSAAERWKLENARPSLRRLFGRTQVTSQPAFRHPLLQLSLY